MALEFKVITKEIGKLAINYNELKAGLSTSLKVYEGINVVDNIDYDNVTPFYEDNINGVTIYAENKTGNKLVTFDNAKLIRAKLNKVSKVINDRKIEIKKEFLKPYEIVDAQAKELMAIINEVNSTIDSQVKASEEKERQEKYNAIFKLWEDKKYNEIGIAFTEVLEPKWLNKTTNMKAIEEEIQTKIYKFKSDLNSIDQLVSNPNKALLLKSKYLLHPDLSKIIQEYNDEEAKAKELLSKKKEKKETTEEQALIFTNSYIITGDVDSHMKVYEFLKENNIQFEIAKEK